MKSIRSLALAAIVAISAGSVASAQFDPGLGTASLKINGTLPAVSDPINQTVAVGTTWTIAIEDPSNIGSGFILLAGTSLSAGAYPALPWGGGVDIPTPTIPMDGIGYSVSTFDTLAVMPFAMTLPLPGPACTDVTGPAVQAICLDATNGPFFLRNTQAGQPVRPVAALQTLSAGNIGDDAFVQVALNCPAKFCGVNYTQMFVGSNGQISFTAGSTDFSPTTGEFANGFRATGTTLAPGVAAMWGDYARSTTLTDTITVAQDTVTGNVTVSYLNQFHWSSSTAAGSWSVTFDSAADTVHFDHTAYLNAAAADGIRIFGVTDGLATGTNTVSAIAALPGGPGYTTTAAPESICESVAAATAPSTPTSHFIHTGAAAGDFVWTVVWP